MGGRKGGGGASHKSPNQRRIFVALPTEFILYFILEDPQAVFGVRETAWLQPRS